MRRLGIVRLVVPLAIALTAVLAAGCGGAPKGGSGAGPAKPKPPALEQAEAVTKRIVAAEGGAIGLKTGEAAIRVTFPLEALPRDAELVATPYSTAPGEDADTQVKGFQLEEKGTGTMPALKYPAYVEMVVAKELPADTKLVSYNDDGTFEVLPTKVKVGKGVSAVFALAPHFSGMSLRSGHGKAGTDFSDFDWVVYVNDTQSGQTGFISQSIKLNLRATNTGGDIAGDYSGDATIKSTNEGSAMGGTMSSPQTGQATAKITLTAGDPLASLTPDDPLAPLEPDPLEGVDLSGGGMPSWWGTGSITMSAMSAAGTAEGHIGGYGGSTGVSNTSTLPVVLTVTGTQVELRVSGLAPGPMTFKGYVIGEGKKK